MVLHVIEVATAARARQQIVCRHCNLVKHVLVRAKPRAVSCAPGSAWRSGSAFVDGCSVHAALNAAHKPNVPRLCQLG